MTDKQLQHLLGYLGYDTGGVGNGYGPKTTQAVKDFQSFYGLPVSGQKDKATEKALIDSVAYDKFKPPDSVPNLGTSEIPAWWATIKYFNREEFRCPCEKWCNGYPVEPSEKLVRFMDAMRGDFGKAVIVVPPDGHSGGSGVRCQTYNDSLKGSVTNSYHTTGKAADFSAPGVCAATIESYLAAALSAGKIRYWYCISSGNYHVDVD